MKTLYIVGPKDRGEGVYSLIADDGEFMASHFCSHAVYAKSDLHDGRSERKEKWSERFGEYKVVWLGEDSVTEDELIKRNKEWYEKSNQ